VQRVIDKGPHSFDNKAITVERQYIEEETNYRGYDKCTIEVTGMNQATTPFHITFEFTGPNQILEFILKNWKMYWPEQSFTDLGPYVLILMTAQ
jgi:hypothetical protein